jgi:hypothetical protein
MVLSELSIIKSLTEKFEAKQALSKKNAQKNKNIKIIYFLKNKTFLF